MSNSFIKIANSFFDIPKNDFNEDLPTKLTYIGTEGFTIYCYLLIEQGNKSFCTVTLGGIQAFLNRNKDTNKKQCREGLRDIRTIRDYLKKLKEYDYIQCEELDKNIMKNSTLVIRVNDITSEEDCTGFSAISEEIFTDYIHIWGHIQWTIFCYLYKNHNIDFGGELDLGFANPSENLIAKIIGKSLSCVKSYVNKFPKSIVKVQHQDKIIVNGRPQQMPNHYIVYPKADPSNKYYLNFKKAS